MEGLRDDHKSTHGLRLGARDTLSKGQVSRLQVRLGRGCSGSGAVVV